MTIAPERPAFAAACDCDTLLVCGHCACDRCEDCAACSGGGKCGLCPCAMAELLELAAWRRRAELYLGTHETHWLFDKRYEELLRGLTLFVAVPRLIKRVGAFPKALHKYCIDSGGFSELQKYGVWRLNARQYAALIRRIVGELGPELCQWVAPQDCMTEDLVIFGGVGARGVQFVGTREMRGLEPGEPEQDRDTAVLIHQQLTLDNYLELVSLAPEIKFIPVLQGQTLEDYERHDRMYRDAGVNLSEAPVVGLGSVCRRQATREIEEIVNHFHAKGYQLHGFGVKTQGLERYGRKATSADSLAWSDVARQEKIQLFGCTHKNCANCPFYAYRWHQNIVHRYLTVEPAKLARPDIEALTAAVLAAHRDRDKDALVVARVAYEQARAAAPALHKQFDAVLNTHILAMVGALIADIAAAVSAGDVDRIVAAQNRYEEERDRCPWALHGALDARLAELQTPAAA